MLLPPFEWKTLRPQPVIGVDEVGRGCLAGPVYAGACILLSDAHISSLTDSKLISENRRYEIAALIEQHHAVSTDCASLEEIDELNILQASLLAMRRAVLKLQKKIGFQSAHILVDGKFKIPDLPGFVQTPLIKGDLRAAPISAAAIVAKVTRDRLMVELGKELPQYGFEKHKGYASATHRAAIQKWGPTSHHRKSFAGVKEYLESAKGT
jgi:ribonuclease HII